jgi:hypothetical protein
MDDGTGRSAVEQAMQFPPGGSFADAPGPA